VSADVLMIDSRGGEPGAGSSAPASSGSPSPVSSAPRWI
jgi:hypothetical protein